MFKTSELPNLKTKLIKCNLRCPAQQYISLRFAV